MRRILIITLLLATSWSASSNWLSPFSVGEYDESRAENGTTLFSYNYNKKSPRMVEVNMDGDVVWEYYIPESMMQRGSMLMDVERLENGNTLFNVKYSGIYEIDSRGSVVWKHLDPKTSHDIDRLPNGNTIYVRAWVNKGDSHVVEVNPAGDIVWQWDGLKEFDVLPYSNVEREGWMHVNAVTRFEDESTLISLRNLQMVIRVDSDGDVVWKQTFNCRKAEKKWSLGHKKSLKGCNPHEAEISEDGSILITATRHPDVVYQLDVESGERIWKWHGDTSQRIRDADRLPNGNILIQDNNKLIEVAPNKDIVWTLNAKHLQWRSDDIRAGIALYKAQRIVD